MKYLLRNVNLLDVECGKIVKTDILMENGVFTRIEPDIRPAAGDVCETAERVCKASEPEGRAEASAGGAASKGGTLEVQKLKEIFCDGLFALPGLIDAHSHVELSMLSSASFAEVLLQKGTTAAVLDAHDAVNVLGVRGAAYLMREMAHTPFTPVWMASPCVPSAPGYEDCFGQIELADVRTMIEEYGMYGIAEAMDFHRVIEREASLAAILAYAREKGLLIDGHAPCVRGEELDAYIAAGVKTDHESVTVEEMLEKYEKGMYVIVRRGSLKEPASAKELLEKVGETERVLLSTDGCITVQDMLAHGHMNYALAQLVAEGVEPMRAVRMATLYPAKAYGLSHMGSVAAGKKADLLLVKDLQDFEAVSVYVDGMPLLPAYEREVFPEEVLHSLHHRTFAEQDVEIAVPAKAKEVQAVVLAIVDGTLETRKEEKILRLDADKLSLPRDILYCAVADRYRKEGSVGTGLVCGAGVFRGAVAGSIAQDTQNLIGLGNNRADICIAMNEVLKRQGGVAFVQDGEVKAFLALPVMGILSQKPAGDFAKEVQNLNLLLKEAGMTLSNPLLTLSLQIPLAVIPELAITNRGLLDVAQNRFIPVCRPV